MSGNMTTDPPPVLRRDCPFCRDELARLRAEVADLTRHAEALYTDLADLDDIRSGSVHLNSMAAYRRDHPLPPEKP
jgi:hypothetical protein